MTSVLLGASSRAQLDENLGALGNTAFSAKELELIDKIAAGEADIDHWRKAADD